MPLGECVVQKGLDKIFELIRANAIRLPVGTKRRSCSGVYLTEKWKPAQQKLNYYKELSTFVPTCREFLNQRRNDEQGNI
jgi:hypothetical protein